MTDSNNSGEGQICGLVNLTVRCNQDCVFCCDGDVKDSGYHLSQEEAREKIREIAATGADSVTFIGGEPLVRKDLVDLVAFARGQGLRVGITSNGTLLTKERLEALVEAGLTSIEISVHSFDDELSDRISRRKNTASRQRRALELFAPTSRDRNTSRDREGAGPVAGDGLYPGGRPQAAAPLADAHGSYLEAADTAMLTPHPSLPGLSINFVAFAHNYRELPSFATAVAKEYPYADELFINFLDPIGYPAHDHSLVPRYEEVQPYLREALDIAQRAGLSFTVDSVPGCVLGPYFLYLRATKEKLRGVRYAKTTLRITDPSPDPDLSQYYRVNACFDCPVSGLCPGVNFRYLGIYGPGEIRPFDASLLARGSYRVPAGLEETAAAALSAGADFRPFGMGNLEPLVITEKCNSGCSWCPCKEDGSGALAPVALARRSEELAGEGGRPVLLTGGEPATHPGFFKFLKLLSRSGRKVGFATNGRVFGYEQWARKAVASGASFVVFRLPAPLASLEDVTGDAEAEVQTRRGLATLLSQRALLVVAEVGVPEGSEQDLHATLDWLNTAGVHRVSVRRQS